MEETITMNQLILFGRILLSQTCYHTLPFLFFYHPENAYFMILNDLLLMFKLYICKLSKEIISKLETLIKNSL